MRNCMFAVLIGAVLWLIGGIHAGSYAAGIQYQMPRKSAPGDGCLPGGPGAGMALMAAACLAMTYGKRGRASYAGTHSGI
jgi:hypothetical protein